MQPPASDALSQHVGGFVISEQPLHHLVPIERAAMKDRTIIQWDKDDLETLGLLKVDCLALGMLTCISKCLNLLRQHRGRDLTPATIPVPMRLCWSTAPIRFDIAPAPVVTVRQR